MLFFFPHPSELHLSIKDNAPPSLFHFLSLLLLRRNYSLNPPTLHVFSAHCFSVCICIREKVSLCFPQIMFISLSFLFLSVLFTFVFLVVLGIFLHLLPFSLLPFLLPTPFDSSSTSSFLAFNCLLSSFFFTLILFSASFPC